MLGRSVLRLTRRRPARTVAFGLSAAFALANVLAWKHAHSMTHFVPGGGSWKGRPEDLSWRDKVGALFTGARLARPTHDARPDQLGLEHAVHTFAGEAGTLEAWSIPHPRPRGVVLVLHGYGRCKAALLPEARAFHDLGYACFLLDFRGSGGSAGSVTTIGYREADDVARAVAYIRQTWPGQPVVLYGQSMGSAAALRAVGVLGVEADGLVLECPFDRLRSTVQMRFKALGVPSFPGADLLVFWGGVQHGFNGFRHNPAEYARGVGCPTLLLHGGLDPRVPLGQISAIRARLNGNAAVHVFDGLGHESYVTRCRDEWLRVVGDFLGAQSGQAQQPQPGGDPHGDPGGTQHPQG